MTTVLEERLDRIEKKIDLLLGGPSQQPAATGTPTDTLPFDKLSADWANRMFDGVSKDKKDVPRWAGESMIGKVMSECPAEWHDVASGYFEWKARLGRNETPVRTNAKGKPWHESDSFQAKLHRTWAAYLRSQPPKAAVVEGQDDIPF